MVHRAHRPRFSPHLCRSDRDAKKTLKHALYDKREANSFHDGHSKNSEESGDGARRGLRLRVRIAGIQIAGIQSGSREQSYAAGMKSSLHR